ncbi:Crp/Fnr family transcriptional regulator [Ancylobacter terrae]|uniref:Crp/Fnr family transcriptional regulator n=1 Tax=Ancylobacter sp. sgz301288 TaxID=3342077 RepID=UPI00385812E9
MLISAALRSDALRAWPLPPVPSDAGAPALVIAAREPVTPHTLAEAHLYRVETGCVALCRQIDAERRQILDIIGPGRLMDPGLAGRLPCEIVAFAPTRLVPVDAPAAGLEAAHQQLMLDRALGHLTRLGKLGAGERVAEALLDLAGQYAAQACFEGEQGETFPFHLSRGDLADWLGLTLETVSRCMSRLKQDGVIDFGKGPTLTLLDRPALTEIARGRRKLQALYAPRQAG